MAKQRQGGMMDQDRLAEIEKDFDETMHCEQVGYFIPEAEELIAEVKRLQKELKLLRFSDKVGLERRIELYHALEEIIEIGMEMGSQHTLQDLRDMIGKVLKEAAGVCR